MKSWHGGKHESLIVIGGTASGRKRDFEEQVD